MSESLVHHERALVGLAMIDPPTIDRCEIELLPYRWIDDSCNHLWPVLVSMRMNGEPIKDLVNVVQRAKGKVEPAEIGKLCNIDCGIQKQDAYHLSFLVAEIGRSKLRSIAAEIQRQVEFEDPVELREWVAKQLYMVNQKTNTKSASEIMFEVIEQSKVGKPTAVVSTGVYDLDRSVGKLRPGQLLVLAARPSVGKSALASQIAVHAAKEDHGVLFVSLEMTSFEAVSRVIAMETNLDMRNVLDGTLSKDSISVVEGIAESYRSIPLFIEQRRGMNIGQLTSVIRSVSSSRKLGLVVIDYLGLIVGDKRKQRWEAITEISHSLKTLAQTESIPILALCQLNRDSEGEVPKLSHLRDSGSIEQDADIVMLLHRESKESAETELFIAKNRNGPTGKISLLYEATQFSFLSAVKNFDTSNRGQY